MDIRKAVKPEQTSDLEAVSARLSTMRDAFELARRFADGGGDMREQVLQLAEDAHAWFRPETAELWTSILGEYYLASALLARSYRKPLGYAGDYETIAMMYRNEPAGEGAFGRYMDEWALSQPCPQAVRNRRNIIFGEIERRSAGKEVVRVTSLGSGPADEVFLLAQRFPEKRFEITLVDIDPRSFQHVRARMVENPQANLEIDCRRANLIRVGEGSRKLDIPDQDLIYSLGLIDYLEDEVIVGLLDWSNGQLGEDGATVLGNFREGHPNQMIFEKLLEWPLKLRSREHLMTLADRSSFDAGRCSVGVEAAGVQLFLQARR